MEKTLPDIQEMDMKYERFYLVPWPDYQKFEELDPEQVYMFPTCIDHKPVCFVDAEWVGRDYED